MVWFARRGLTTEAVGHLLCGEWGLHRSEAVIQPERLGVRCEGICLRYLDMHGATSRDVEPWAILADEELRVPTRA